MTLKNIYISCTIAVIFLFTFFGFKHYAYSVKDSHSLTTQISSKIFDFNSFSVNVDNKIDIDDFTIINQNNGKVIFKNGECYKTIKNDYGYRIFEVYEKGKKIYEIGHFVKNNWITLDYTLVLTLKNNMVVPTLKLKGENASYDDFYYKRFEYDGAGKLAQTTHLTRDLQIYNVEMFE